MRLPTLHTVCRFDPYPHAVVARLRQTASQAPCALARTQQAIELDTLRCNPTSIVLRTQLLETAVAAWPDVLRVPSPGSTLPCPPT